MANYIETKMIPIDQIGLASWHPRKTFENIEAIGESISEIGQMQPICVSPRDGKYLVAFGGRRLTGAKTKGLQKIRAEIWELTDLELKFWQARELYHTDSLRDTPDIDTFYRYLFHEAVEDKIQVLHVATVDKPCPRCYQCKSAQTRPDQRECPAFLSYEAFAQMIGKEVDKSTISRAFTKDIFREEIPEVKDLDLPSPSATLPTLSGLLKDGILDKKEVLALATKTADGELGSPTEEQKNMGDRGTVHILGLVGKYLRRNNENKIPDKVREGLIYTPNYGPAEAEYDMEDKQTIKPEETMLDIGFKLEHNIFTLSQILKTYNLSEIPTWRHQTIISSLQLLNETITAILNDLGIKQIIEGEVIK